MYKFPLIIVVFSLLAGCASTKQKYNLDPGIKTRTVSQWQTLIEDYYHLSNVKSYSEYLDIVRSFDNVKTTQICNAENQKKLKHALAINPTSLFATMTLYRCAKNSNLPIAKTLLENTKAISTVLIGPNNGQSSKYPIRVREIDEAYFILEAAGFDVLGSEITFDENLPGFQYKIHSIDSLTHKFRYHYVSNANFMYAIHRSAMGNQLSFEQSMKIALTSYREQYHVPILIHDLKQQLTKSDESQTQDLDAIEKIINYPQQRQLVAVHAAKLLHEKRDYQALVNLVEPLVDYAEHGSVEAYLALLDIFVSNSQSKSEFLAADQIILKLLEYGSEGQTYQAIIDNLLETNSPQQQVKLWHSATENPILVQAITHYFQFPENHQLLSTPKSLSLLEFAAAQNHPPAMFILGQYYFTLGPESQNLKPNIANPRDAGRKLIQSSASLGFVPAKTYLNEYF